MAVAFDVTSEFHGSGTSASNTGSAISGSATGLLVFALFVNTGGTTTATGISATWAGTGMTQLGSTITIDNGSSKSLTGAIFMLANPTPGAQTLALSWTNSMNTVYYSYTSWTGTDTSTPATNPVSTTGNAASFTFAQSSVGASNATTSAFITGSGTGTNTGSDDNGGSQTYLDNAGATGSTGRRAGSGTTNWTYSGITSDIGLALSVEIQAPAAGGSTSTGMGLLTMGVGR